MGVEDARTTAIENGLFARGIGEAETTPARRLTRRTNNRHTLRHHDLIANMRVQIPTTHKARLRRMCMYPPQHHQLLLVAIIKQLLFVQRLTRVARRRLLGDDQPRDEEGVGLEDPAQHAASFEVEPCVGRGRREELLAQLGGEKDRAEGVPVFEVGGWLEGEGVKFVRGSWGTVVGGDFGRKGRCVVGVFAWDWGWARLSVAVVLGDSWWFGG